MSLSALPSERLTYSIPYRNYSNFVAGEVELPYFLPLTQNFFQLKLYPEGLLDENWEEEI